MLVVTSQKKALNSNATNKQLKGKVKKTDHLLFVQCSLPFVALTILCIVYSKLIVNNVLEEC